LEECHDAVCAFIGSQEQQDPMLKPQSAAPEAEEAVAEGPPASATEADNRRGGAATKYSSRLGYPSPRDGTDRHTESSSRQSSTRHRPVQREMGDGAIHD